ncbi:putative Rho GTPase activator [Phyllosticta citriasiana]|uniref:putative Rho GTPase activator n=1 Tax=Phyllosticta citriasiana TaxID=595635 RepID=UPI0030FDE593
MDPSHDSSSSPTDLLNPDGLASSNGAADPAHHPPAPAVDSGVQRVVDEVIQSDIGVPTLLTRLKQSIASAKDFSTFLSKRSKLEEEHAQGLKKLCRATNESIRRHDSRQGTYLHQFEEGTRLHERMGDNGMQFALSLHQMHEDLNELTNNVEKGRKQWKSTGLASEKKVSDAIQQMEKAKAKYDSLAEDYDRVKTGDKSAGRVFGIKGPKSAAQHEEDVHKKLQTADQDYKSKVETAQMLRTELVERLRPQAISAIMELIKECDSALILQMQKFATFNEKLLLSNGILVAPTNNPGEPEAASLREIFYKVDNDKDLTSFITGHASKVPRPPEIKYQQHHTLAPSQPPPTAAPPVQSPPFQSSPPQPPPVQTNPTPQSQQPPFLPYDIPQQTSPILSSHGDSFKQNPYSSPVDSRPPYPINDIPTQGSYPPPPGGYGGPVRQTSPPYGGNAPPLKPVFGVSLDELFRRDGSPVPMVVYQCIQAVELFGLDAEGIYRVPGTSTHIQDMKAMFDHDSAAIDFRNPEAFFHDVNSVAGLLKQFFRELPDPLLTHEHYQELIEAAKIEDDTVRRDSLHAIINALPDPNYATLRALVLHLNRVQERSASNRMSSSNLAICFAPTIMGQHQGQMVDAGLQAKVVDTILVNTYQIFDED